MSAHGHDQRLLKLRLNQKALKPSVCYNSKADALDISIDDRMDIGQNSVRNFKLSLSIRIRLKSRSYTIKVKLKYHCHHVFIFVSKLTSIANKLCADILL